MALELDLTVFSRVSRLACRIRSVRNQVPKFEGYDLYQLVNFLVVTVIITQGVYANDTSVSAAAGGIISEKNDAIEMRKERLKLSLDKVTVDYEFFNKTSNNVDLNIAFPLPPIYRTDEITSGYFDPFYDVYRLIENSAKYSFNSVDPPQRYLTSADPFQDFELKIEGQPHAYRMRYAAIARDGTDITSKLLAEGIPLSQLYINGFQEEPVYERVPEFKKRLKSLHLLDSSGYVTWHNEVTYMWQDTFPAKSSHKVFHSYRPMIGRNWISIEGNKKRAQLFSDVKIANGTWAWDEYCPSQDLQKLLLKNVGSTLKDFEVREIAYVLKTGANWAGPIHDFELEVVPPRKDSKVVFCWPNEIQRKPDGSVIAKAIDFVPKEDLKILILDQIR